MKSKVCRICRLLLPLNAFPIHCIYSDGHKSICFPCWRPIRNIKRKKYKRSKLYQKKKDQRRTGKLKIEMIAQYGGECSCCGESRLSFLTLEHINHDGKAHREKVGYGHHVWRDLKRQGWPKDNYTVLCMNCNFATRYGEACPHHMEDR